MSVNFLEKKCQGQTNNKIFGLCDDPPQAKIEEEDGASWIAVVANDNRYEVTFTAIDNCIPINRKDGKPAKRCDGMLTYNFTTIFVELKERVTKGTGWIREGEEQLRTTIGYFEDTKDADTYRVKKAYIANAESPRFRESQAMRMEQFYRDTGYVLRIERRIVLD